MFGFEHRHDPVFRVAYQREKINENISLFDPAYGDALVSPRQGAPLAWQGKGDQIVVYRQ